MLEVGVSKFMSARIAGMVSHAVVMTPQDPAIFLIPIDFVLFGLTLVCVALFHHHTLRVGITGLVVIVVYKILFTSFKTGPGLIGFAVHVRKEWVGLANLLCLLLGFAVLSRHFEKSHLPLVLPKYLPHDWKGGFLLLCVVWVLSSFLDNIAGALIGGALAHQLFRAKVHLAYLTAIVAASNAGGAWSVLGDTTTTMMWIAGVLPRQLAPAIVASVVALLVFGIPAAIKQQRHSPILTHVHTHVRVDWARVAIVALMLVLAIGTNMIVNGLFPAHSDSFPSIGAAVWTAIVVSLRTRRPDWEALPRALRSSIFLLTLVLIASMMPVEKLPDPLPRTAFGLGFLSAVFDNIPLTALALKQGGYDWGLLAYAVGFGGSMIWFGSSAGVALSSNFPEAKSVTAWVKAGWFVAAAYVAGFAVMLMLVGWHPEPMRRPKHAPPKTAIEPLPLIVLEEVRW